jgi:hypothetical protein
VVLGLILLCVLVGGGLVGRVAYVAPMCDLEDNFPGFIQCFCNHLFDDQHFSQDFLIAMGLEIAEVVEVIEDLFPLIDFHFFSQEQGPEVTVLDGIVCV